MPRVNSYDYSFQQGHRHFVKCPNCGTQIDLTNWTIAIQGTCTNCGKHWEATPVKYWRIRNIEKRDTFK